jgi:hypothetical protein
MAGERQAPKGGLRRAPERSAKARHLKRPRFWIDGIAVGMVASAAAACGTPGGTNLPAQPATRHSSLRRISRSPQD